MDGKKDERGVLGGKEWDGRWESGATVTDSGWTLEIRIPFNTVRYNPEEESWGINFVREIKRKDETIGWANTGMDTKNAELFGGLRGINKFLKERSELQKNWKLIPYASAKVMQNQGENLFEHNELRIGGDIESRLSENILFSFTANPDYYYLEPDPDQINLEKGVELYLPEKRPFFIEGLELLSTPLIDVFYTRRLSDIDWGGKMQGTHKNIKWTGLVVKTLEVDTPYFVGAFKWNPHKNLALRIFGVNADSRPTVSFDLIHYLSLEKMKNTMVLQVAQDGMEEEENKAYAFYDFYETQNVGVYFGYQTIEPNFNPKTSYIDYRLYNSFGGGAGYTMWLRKAFIEKINFSINYFDYKDQDNLPLIKGANGGITLYTKENRFSSELWYSETDWGYMGEVFRNRIYTIELRHKPMERTSSWISYKWGDYYGGKMDYYSLGISFIPFGDIIIDWSLDYQILKYDSQKDTTKVSLLKAEVPVGRFIFRLWSQYSTISENFQMNFLVKYSFFTGSDIYLAVNNTRDEDFKSQETTLFTKLGYTINF